MAKTGLSKSRIIAGRQCPKRLYLETYHPELKDDSGSEALFAIGNAFGELARDLFPGGLLIEQDDDLRGALATTENAMRDDRVGTIFEATFSYDGVLVRADILKKENDGLVLTEIKASTSVKPYHAADCAVQAWVLKSLGHDVQRIQLGHVNNQFVYRGDGNYHGILKEEDLTGEVTPIINQVDQWVTEMREVLVGDEPEIAVGPQCSSPYDCPFQDYCWPPMPDYPVSSLPGKGPIVQALLGEGIEDIRDIPAGRLTNPNQERVRRVTVAGIEELDPKAAELLNSLPYPRYHLDFETAGPTIPVWAGMRPNQQVPFQFSCHIESDENTLTHREFLDTTGNPPMRPLAEAMIDALGDEGPVFMYTGFERRVIHNLIHWLPDLKAPLSRIVDRLVDLYPIVKEHYYHPDMQGSWSIKKVLPAMVPELQYSDLDGVSDGMAASNAYLEIIDPETTGERKAQLEAELKRYCHLDTLAMVKVAQRLAGG